jgi:hypothetical protein
VSAARAALALLGLTLSSCFSVQWERRHSERPIRAEELVELRPGESHLEDALRLLGAPLDVSEDGTGGAILAWGWSRSGALGFGVSVPLGDWSASLDYDRGQASLEGVLLFFDADWRLTGSSRGRLTELVRVPLAGSAPSDAGSGAQGGAAAAPRDEVPAPVEPPDSSGLPADPERGAAADDEAPGTEAPGDRADDRERGA